MSKPGPWDEDSMWVPDSEPNDNLPNRQYGVHFYFELFMVFTTVEVDASSDKDVIITNAINVLAEQGFDVDYFGSYEVEINLEACSV